mmetsp:Transcript_28171/g.58723  ORF Transcript_28171/g.58723 Transcript_28171/m.58723 type:complete len:91 (+) Transcript_28171:933-1205(+)
MWSGGKSCLWIMGLGMIAVGTGRHLQQRRWLTSDFCLTFFFSFPGVFEIRKLQCNYNLFQVMGCEGDECLGNKTIKIKFKIQMIHAIGSR